MRRLVLLAVVWSAGCNSILDIPERSLLVDEGAADALPDLSLVETGLDSSVDTFVEDSGAPDTGEEQTDTLVDDSTLADSEPSDSELPDSLAPDTSAPDTAVRDTGVRDTAVPDTGVPDTAVPDTSPRDTAVPDTRDSAPVDMGVDAPTCGVTGAPCCGAVAATCDTNAACASGTCVAAAGACVRSSDCTGTICAGPTLCGGKLCFTCSAAPGTVALGGACTSSSQCASGPCNRGRCTVPCANAITGNADCTALPNGTCTATNYSYTSGGVTASGKVGFCARGCGRDADCPTGDYCRAYSNDVADRVDVVCGPPRPGATGEPGATCASDNDCKGGYCMGTLSGPKCTSYCASSADCPTILPNCNTLTFTRPVSMLPQPGKACGP